MNRSGDIVRSLMSEDVKAVQEKVRLWLVEEGFVPKSIANGNAYFNYEITLGAKIRIVQNIARSDSIHVYTDIGLSEEQLALLEALGEKKQEYLWELRMNLLNDPYIFGFEIYPSDWVTRFVHLQSKPIFYDALTKDRLMNTIYYFHKFIVGIFWLLDKHVGSPKPSGETMFPNNSPYK